MNCFAKILLIIGFGLLTIFILTPNNYDACHSDLTLPDFSSQICFPDFVYQFKEISLFGGICCIFSSFIFFEEMEKPKDENYIFTGK